VKHFATEFLIVVAGILAALAVDQWRQDREELRILNESLTDVAVEIRGNINTVERILNRALVQKMNGLGTALRFLSDPEAPVGDPALLLQAFAMSARGATPWLVNDRFEALRNSGNLRLLRDSKLVDSLVEAYEGPQVLYSQVDRLQGTYPTVVNEIMPATMQVQWNPIRWYSRESTAPVIPDPADTASAVAEMRARRVELLRLARAEAAVATGKWYALERADSDLHQALQLLARWDPQAASTAAKTSTP
jgi:hypothetical protein